MGRYDVETGRKEHNFVDAAREGDLYVRSVCFSPDGRYLATGMNRSIKGGGLGEGRERRAGGSI